MNDAPAVRLAVPSEAAKITNVINDAFRVVEESFFEGDRITLAEVRQLFGKGAFLVAGEDGAVDGCVYVEPRGERAYLGLLSVDPVRQQSGLGSRLMTAAEEHGRKQGARFMDIYLVNLRTELTGFYEHRGYFANGTTPFPADVPTKQPCHFINMSKQL